MRYFIDTEFAERPCSIDLISLAIVAEDGREFYAESVEFRKEMANDWVRANVLPQLWSRRIDTMTFLDFEKERSGNMGGFLYRSEIAHDVRQFIGDDKPEFWGYYCDYDWVVFCWLFGSMVDLPKGWPMYCRDIKQLCDHMGMGSDELPKQNSTEHHALSDARWNKEAWEFTRDVVKVWSKLEEQRK